MTRTRDASESEYVWPDEAHEICAELGTTPSETAAAHEKTRRWVDFVQRSRTEQCSVELPTGSTIHKHQLLIGPEGNSWIALRVTDEMVDVCRVEPPMSEHDGIVFKTAPDEELLLTLYDAAAMEPQTVTRPDGTVVPVFAY